MAACLVISVSYAPVMLLGHYTYGNKIADSIINSMQTVWIEQAVNLLIAFHCMLTLILI